MELFIALRYLRGKRRFGFISLIGYISIAGVLLGAAVLVLALAIANGFEKEVRRTIIDTYAHARIQQYHGRAIASPDSLRRHILQHSRVTGAAPYVMGKAIFQYDRAVEGGILLGIDPEIESTVTRLDSAIIRGEYSIDSATAADGRFLPGILLGSALAEELRADVGAALTVATLVSLAGDTEPVSVTSLHTVRGIFETGMYEYDRNLAYVSIPVAQMLQLVAGVSGFQIRTDDLNAAGQIARSVVDSLGGYPYRAVDWMTQNRALFQWINLQRLMLTIVISLIIAVAAFNITSTLSMMIVEKNREIGVLMSIGGSRGSVMRVFMIVGGIVGALGAGAGTLLGVGFALIQQRWQIITLPPEVYFISSLPIAIHLPATLAVFGIASLLSILSTIYPAWRAASMLPAQAIRKE
jgi:lipoprotein-releasing system permease protein